MQPFWSRCPHAQPLVLPRAHLERRSSLGAVRAALRRSAVPGAADPRAHFAPNAVQRSTLLSIKTGNCSEDCGYCSQSKRYQRPSDHAPPPSIHRSWPTSFLLLRLRIHSFNSTGSGGRRPLSSTCPGGRPRSPGLGSSDRYDNDNLTPPLVLRGVVTTHTYQDRLDTLRSVREAGLKVCSGGIVGLGESRLHRAGLIATLANLDPPPVIGADQPFRSPFLAPHSPTMNRPIFLSSRAPSLPPASPCHAAMSACPPAASR